MALEVLQFTAWEIVDQFARGDYDSIIQRCIKSRLTSNDLHKVISDYGGRLMSAPKGAYQKLDAVQVKDAAIPTWSVRVPLWTEDGRSDLTLELTIALGAGNPTVELDDLHVL
jgi:hypothetical protein